MNENTPEVTPNNVETLCARINSKTFVYIKSTDNDVPLARPVYAVNWFNTERLWLYDFYNKVAAASVAKVGGKPFFKGRVIDVLLGNDAERREVLLIVNYPSAKQFITMVESTLFKLISILRLLSVEKFTFGFTQRTDSGEAGQESGDNKIYAIHHYRAHDDLAIKLQGLLESGNVELFFAGRISSLLYQGDKKQADNQVPCLMNGLLLLRAESTEQIERVINSDDYQVFH